MYNNSEKIFEIIESKIKNKEFNNKEELANYLTNLKDRGQITQAQINLKYGEILNSYDDKNNSSGLNTRTPKTMEYAYSNISEGFTKTGMLVLMAMSVPALIAMLVLLNK